MIVTLSGSRRAVIGVTVCAVLVAVVSYLYYHYLWRKFWRFSASEYEALVAEERADAKSSNADDNEIQARP